MNPPFTIRNSIISDTRAVQEIYAYYVENTTSTLEEEAPTSIEIVKRWSDVINNNLPFIVACIDEEVVGYAYAFPYRVRKAYRYTLEESVYVKHGFHGKGIGKALLKAIEISGREKGYKQLVAIITNDHSYETGRHPSVALHSSCGYKQAGNLENVGFKFGKWIDTIIMQLPL